MAQSEYMYKKQPVALTLLCVVTGALISALNINSFVNAGGLFPSGFNGLTILIQRIFSTFFNLEVPFTAINILLNVVPAIIAYKIIGKKFTLFSCLMIGLSSVFVDVLPLSSITYDPLLIGVFGGIFNGLAISIALKGNASSGGTDFIAMSVSVKTNLSTWNYVFAFNVCVLIIAGYLFGWDKALYSIIFQFCSTQVINLLHQKYKQMTLFVITDIPDQLCEELLIYTHHGITRFDGEGAYSRRKHTLLYTVVGRGEAKQIIRKIKEIDPNAFVNVAKTEYVEGRFHQAPIE